MDLRMPRSPNFDSAADELAQVAHQFYQRGWVLGTSGNFSATLSQQPLKLAITASGLHKGELTRQSFLLVDGQGAVLDGEGNPSAETSIHLTIASVRGAGSILHTHSVWSTLLSDAHAGAGGIRIEGFEMLKGLSGVTTHEHAEWLPIVENSQDYSRLAAVIRQTLESNPTAHGILLRRHGLYTWGQDIQEAKRHIEIFEFLLEVLVREKTL
jgi:methylthioribulose-1-phosphate dehydratase